MSCIWYKIMFFVSFNCHHVFWDSEHIITPISIHLGLLGFLQYVGICLWKHFIIRPEVYSDGLWCICEAVTDLCQNVYFWNKNKMFDFFFNSVKKKNTNKQYFKILFFFKKRHKTKKSGVQFYIPHTPAHWWNISESL